MLKTNKQTLSWCEVSLGSLCSAFCRLTPSSLFSNFLYCISFSCPPILICGAVICKASQTRRPVCMPPAQSVGALRCMGHGTGYPGQRRPCVQPSKAFRFIVWMFLYIYGSEMKRFPCSFLTSTLPTLLAPHPVPFPLSFRPILRAMLLCWPATGSHRGEKKEQQCGFDWVVKAVRCSVLSEAFARHVLSEQHGPRGSPWRSVLAQPKER